MQKQSNAKENITPPINCIAPWRVQTVAPLENYQISVQFIDGTQGIVDMTALILSENAGVFKQLRDQTIFKQVHVELGAVTWPGSLDLAPDAMHTELQKTGRWTL